MDAPTTVVGFLFPALLVLSYKRVLFEALLPNVLVMYVPAGLLQFWWVGGFSDPSTGLMQALLVFPFFVALAYAGAWAEDRWIRSKRN